MIRSNCCTIEELAIQKYIYIYLILVHINGTVMSFSITPKQFYNIKDLFL